MNKVKSTLGQLHAPVHCEIGIMAQRQGGMGADAVIRQADSNLSVHSGCCFLPIKTNQVKTCAMTMPSSWSVSITLVMSA